MDENHENSVRHKREGVYSYKSFERVDECGTNMKIFRAMFRAQTTGKKVEHMKQGSARLKVTEKDGGKKGRKGLHIYCSISAENLGVKGACSNER